MNKGRQERRDRLGCCGMEDSSLEDRERAEPEGEREMQACTAQAQAVTSTRKRKKRKRQGIKRGEERIREEGEKDGGIGKARGGKE